MTPRPVFHAVLAAAAATTAVGALLDADENADTGNADGFDYAFGFGATGSVP